ncbi:Peptidoglycan/LPS O-acetylase OafA/YrhL, contains acyltransferase and SGNH-hydrolase domains [Catalinimonas alkaloidigena]|uniref:Peptidoglycan/LPS O-acetylase OafA/YrhL, contains acyltransferase and SGNH-hydrolase domains n=1 Tax=Catalinimonas alkaloidigena TaxID=1075417 RepID=A0A1G9QQU1_9BACT|nr:acyltransferase [Catalinimonas alkaloidigena]SDM13211.1 Peptidoglycan/LPS O-acetylase OafA/YrhL, contains acyltransferase and SGNH-hydrolase domains [Catalinimonas alkaloidigena]
MQTSSSAPAAPTLSPTKPHFHALDGLRGVAALAVVVFHFMEWVVPDYRQNFVGQGFLAVDFFFCLSGFVMGYAYDDRLPRMGKKSFFLARLIRLHPLVVLGSVLGLVEYLFNPFASPEHLDAGWLTLLFLGSLLLIPLPLMEARFYNLFSFNAPAWSLFWEYVANVVYAVVLHKLPRRALLVLTLVAAVVLTWVSYRAGNLIGGWSGGTFWDGGARLAYSFSAGLLLYRSRWIIPNRLGFPGLAVLLSLAFLMPYVSWNWLAEALVVIFYFPLLVSLGAGTRLAPSMQQVCMWAGHLSYPLYMTHYAGIWLFAQYYTTHPPDSRSLTLMILGGILFLLGVAYVAMHFYDLPVRRYLAARWKQKRV